jgi:integrase
MSVQKQGDGRYKVRWREMGRHRARVFAHKRDADAYDGEIKRRQRLGEVGIADYAKKTLTELHDEWVESHVELRLATATQKSYDSMWTAHIEPRLGKARLGELTPDALERFVIDLKRSKVGESSIHRCTVILGAMFARAVARGQMHRNPIPLIAKPKQKRTEPIQVALSPKQVETIRINLRSKRDRVLVSLMAYAGLRPGEALHLRWRDVRDDLIHVRGSISDGVEKTTKTGRSRTVRLLSPLAQELREYRMSLGRPGDDELLFAMQDGRCWNDGKWRRFRDRSFDKAVEKVKLPKGTRPYDLRHAFASLMIAAGRNPVEIAGQLGHSPTMLLNTYSHVIDGFEGRGTVDPEAEILKARSEAVRDRQSSTERVA